MLKQDQPLVNCSYIFWDPIFLLHFIRRRKCQYNRLFVFNPINMVLQSLGQNEEIAVIFIWGVFLCLRGCQVGIVDSGILYHRFFHSPSAVKENRLERHDIFFNGIYPHIDIEGHQCLPYLWHPAYGRSYLYNRSFALSAVI